MGSVPVFKMKQWPLKNNNSNTIVNYTKMQNHEKFQIGLSRLVTTHVYAKSKKYAKTRK